MEKKVVIYTSSTCPYCDMAKDFFKSKGIQYEEKNTSEKENREKILEMGLRSVPVIFYGDKHVVGFEPQEVEKLLKDGGYVGETKEEAKKTEEVEKNKEDVKDNGRNLEMKKYVCVVCGYVYDPAIGDEENGVKPGTSFENLAEDWTCPACGVGKDQFEVEE